MEMIKEASSFLLGSYLEHKRDIVDQYLASLLDTYKAIPGKLYDSIRYSLFADAKRIRPILSIASAEASGGKIEQVLPVAAAIEMIHTYSLIHDDLPAMDDDALRRGKPTNHKVFGEATALLAGDALLTMAFTVLSDRSLWKGVVMGTILQIIHEIGLAAGATGMVGGQQIDIESEGSALDITSLEVMHRSKTGALIRAAVRSGALAGGAGPLELDALTTYGDRIGLAFQIVDDILDVEGSTKETGKDTGKDVERGKNTYTRVIGLAESKAVCKELVQEAIHALDQLHGKDTAPLRAIAEYIMTRKR